MAISIKKYINIVSGVGAGTSVRTKDLILRVFTQSQFISPNTVIECESAEDVAEVFGYGSEEHKRATFYFSYISKTITAPKKISFFRDTTTDVDMAIFGESKNQMFETYKNIGIKKLYLLINDTEFEFSVDFDDTILTLSDVATAIETEILSIGFGNDYLKNSTVVWNATRKSFDFKSNSNLTGDIKFDLEKSDAIFSALGWNAKAILIDGQESQSLSEMLDVSFDISTNFATFIYLRDLSLDEKEEAGKWANAQNVECGFVTTTNYDLADVTYERLNLIGGVSLELDNKNNDDYYDMLLPMMIASIDYKATNGTINTMFKDFKVTKNVSKTSDAKYLDARRVNYVGETQTAGQSFAFYQNGFMLGTSSDPLSQNVYFNEVWFKDYVRANILEAFLNLSKISWNEEGRGILLSVLANCINLAKKNGVVSIGKPLNNTQKLYIKQVTNEDEAWREIQDNGYWLDVSLQYDTDTQGIVTHKAVYKLLYSKDDVIRKVEASHILL